MKSRLEKLFRPPKDVKRRPAFPRPDHTSSSDGLSGYDDPSNDSLQKEEVEETRRRKREERLAEQQAKIQGQEKSATKVSQLETNNLTLQNPTLSLSDTPGKHKKEIEAQPGTILLTIRKLEIRAACAIL
jgi:hypothetical protein